MLDDLLVLTSGVVIGAGLMRAAMLWSWMRRPTCTHDRIEVHSTERFANITYAHAICHNCAKPVKFDLGFTADSKGAQMRATTAVIEARGYTLTTGNTFERRNP